MPATAGRVRMPADNRLSVSDSLKSSEIWQKSVGYDPYAPGEAGPHHSSAVSMDAEAKAKGLFALARLTGSSSSTVPGSCKKCGQVGHLAYQCRNDITLLYPDRDSSKLQTCVTSSSSGDDTEDEEEDDLSDSSSATSRLSSIARKDRRRSHRRHRSTRHRKRHRHHSSSSSDADTSSSSDDECSRRSKHKNHHKHRRRRPSRSRSASPVRHSRTRYPLEAHQKRGTRDYKNRL